MGDSIPIPRPADKGEFKERMASYGRLQNQMLMAPTDPSRSRSLPQPQPKDYDFEHFQSVLGRPQPGTEGFDQFGENFAEGEIVGNERDRSEAEFRLGDQLNLHSLDASIEPSASTPDISQPHPVNPDQQKRYKAEEWIERLRAMILSAKMEKRKKVDREERMTLDADKCGVCNRQKLPNYMCQAFTCEKGCTVCMECIATQMKELKLRCQLCNRRYRNEECEKYVQLKAAQSVRD